MASTPIEQAHPTPSLFILRVCREEMLLLRDFFQKKSNLLCGMGSRMWKKGDFCSGNPNSQTQLPPNNRQQLGGLRFHQRMIASGFHI
jgi:hypothetical protein